MNNTELLTAISDLMDQKLESKIVPRIKHLEEDLIPRVAHLEEDLIPRVAHLEEDLIPRVTHLEEDLIPKVKDIAITMENEVIPRLSHMEQCYVDTYERYQKGIDQLDKMQMDIDVIKLTITGHSEQLQNYSGPYLIK